jgi:quercetin dioxygenase-like cupin family protein
MLIVADRSAVTTRADPAHFTGRTWRTDYLRPADAAALAGSRFLYEPGARSHWHVHQCEQAIIAVYGTGLVAWEGLNEPHQLEAGDWWHVSPGVPHWHGATAATAFAHLAVTAGGDTIWLDEVSAEQYAP